MTFIARPSNHEQEMAIKTFLESMKIPFEIDPGSETDHLLSTDANTKRLRAAIEDEHQGNGTSISLDDIWK